MKINRYITTCFTILGIFVSRYTTFGQINLPVIGNEKIFFIDSSKASFLSQTCHICLPNSYAFTYRSEDILNEETAFSEKIVNIDSFNIILSQEIQLALYKTLLLSNYKEEFESVFLKSLKKGDKLEKDFHFSQTDGKIKEQISRFTSYSNPDYNNFYENFYANLNLQQLPKVFKENGRYTFKVSISVEVNEQVENITFTCNNGYVNVQIPANNYSSSLSEEKTTLLATQKFFSSKEALSFQLLNPFRFSFLSCNRILDSELEKFDIESKQWRIYYTITNHEDCGNSLSSYKVNDSIFNFSFLPQAPGLYRIVAKAPCKFISYNPIVQHHDLMLYSEPFYVDDFISFSEQQFFNPQDTTSKTVPFYYYKEGKKVTENCFYYSHKYIINSVNYLPHLQELTKKAGFEITDNVRIKLHPSKIDPYLYHTPIEANLIKDPYRILSIESFMAAFQPEDVTVIDLNYRNEKNYYQYFTLIGNYVNLNGEVAVLKNTYSVTLSNKAKRKNRKFLNQFLIENNLKVVGSSPNIYVGKRFTKIKTNDYDVLAEDKKNKKWKTTKKQEAIIQFASTNPVEIIEMAKKMKKSKLFKKLSNDIWYLEF